MSEGKAAFRDYVSERVFDGKRPIPPERLATLIKIHCTLPTPEPADDK